MTHKELSEDSTKIAIFLSTEFLLVTLISIPLFLFKPANGGNLVMVMSIIFMWMPALARMTGFLILGIIIMARIQRIGNIVR